MTQQDETRAAAEWRVAEAFARIQERRTGGKHVPVLLKRKGVNETRPAQGKGER
jgi:hypothetical protein